MTDREVVKGSSNPVGAMIQRLAQTTNLTSIEIAETLWLATKLEPANDVESAVSDDEGSAVSEDRPAADRSDRSPPIKAHPSASPSSTAEPTPKVDIAASTACCTQPLPPQVLPIQVVDPPMLRDPLAVIRALRPLLNNIEVGLSHRLDEPATVELTARTQICLPVLAPEQAPWFDVILVVDSSASMHLWQRLVKDIVRTLRNYGAFRNIQSFDLKVDFAADSKAENAVMLRSHPQGLDHRPNELIDQQGRRLVIVLSDCAATYWWEGKLLPMLTIWGQHMPTVLWQMLPPWMWRRTALRQGEAVALSNDRPGAANDRLNVQAHTREEPEGIDQRLALPIVTSDVHDLAQWSWLVAGGRQVAPGFLLPHQKKWQSLKAPARSQMQGEDEAASNAALKQIARDRVQRFWQLASLPAQQLLMLLAAAPVITLPIVRLIRNAGLADLPSPLPIAEVFLSGLLQRLPDQEAHKLEQVQQKEPEPIQKSWAISDLVQYGFAPQVREVLLQEEQWLPPTKTVQVINLVSAEIEQRWHLAAYDQTFQAYLKDPQVELPASLAGLQTFATITANILESLGGPYQELVQQLRAGAQKVLIPADELDPRGGQLKTFIYEVAEFVNFPPLKPFECIEAHFKDDAEFPPPLEPHEFIIITVEAQLEPFEFIVARLQRRQDQPQPQPQIAEWDIQRQSRRASRFIEPLTEDFPLEMVSIPGGTFRMGSPDDEPERNEEREFPQHEVTIQPFFMGCYPVTQAQWRVVAALPQVVRSLRPDPAHFKGDSRPVEEVSWNDAEEFCARLSAHTGRQYRLPTEAEWEYACRAGTTTPFHFGETITSELANYIGTTAYANCPKGEYREETTPVDHFGIANAFGLCDMHGNVFEWCQDHWHENYEGAPTDGSAWLSSGESKYRVYRGGSWFSFPGYCRSASRYWSGPALRNDLIGFRVCCSAPRTL